MPAAMRAFHEELFGPVAVLHKVASVDEAIELANDSPYGLGSAVFTRDEDEADYVANRLEVGMSASTPPSRAPRTCRSAASRIRGSDENSAASASTSSRTRSSSASREPSTGGARP